MSTTERSSHNTPQRTRTRTSAGYALQLEVAVDTRSAMSAMPVMEGKAVLFQQFAGIDAHPLCIDASSVDEIVAVGKAMADMTVVVVGAGAAGLAIGKLLHLVGVGDLIGVDREGISTRRCWRATARAQSGGSRRTATAMPPPVVSPTR